jgi:iron complex outermembrane recepter protein
MARNFTTQLKTGSACIAVMGALLSMPVMAQDAEEGAENEEAIVVTGTRIKTAGLESTSPISALGGEQIALQRAVTVEDFSSKMPQLAGGVNSTSVGSDAFGAQTLDLRNLGQNRTLVLINGTRAVPFSFRNAVDVNAIPAPLLKRVDVLTGGAAAVYGADAVAGVVNFIINQDFEGIQASASYRAVGGGGSQKSINLTGGLPLGDRGSIVGYAEYTDRDGLRAGNRNFARRGIATAPIGGNFRDVASGRTFSFDANNNLVTTAQTTDYTPGFLLVQPLERINGSAFLDYDITDGISLYGRVMYSGVKTRGATRVGQNPMVFNGDVQISQTNPFIPADVRPLLTFVGGVANVNVSRSLGEVGNSFAENDRKTWQAQLGLKGDLTPAISWDVYFQQGQTKEDITIGNDGVRANFITNINTYDLFGPGGNFANVTSEIDYGTRKRTQQVASAYVSGDTSDFFNGWAGPLGFTVGYEYRKETGRYVYSPQLGTTFNQGAESAPLVPPFIKVNEVFGEALLPIVSDLPLIKKLTLEGAYRRSWYDKSVGPNRSYDTNKLGVNWVISDDLRLRGTRQSVIRDPNIGEFANQIFSIPFSRLRTVARLFPRYAGDPCVGATNAATVTQCTAQGYRGTYDSNNPANLLGGYFFGGNPGIQAEKGRTWTVGGVFTPSFIPGLNLTVDWYKIGIRDAVGQIQPIDALTSCYITDPRADNPLCQAVTRDPTTGFIRDAFVDDRNLAFIKQTGIDVDFRYDLNVDLGLPESKLRFGYQGSFVTDYTIQRNAVLTPIDCRGSYGARCSSDLVTLVAPDYRHRATLTMDSQPLTVQLGWKRIGSVKDSTVGSTGRISGYNYFDLNLAVRPPIEGLTLSFGIDNLFDKQPPLPINPGVFNTFPDTYDVLGQTFGFTLTYKR